MSVRIYLWTQFSIPVWALPDKSDGFKQLPGVVVDKITNILNSHNLGSTCKGADTQEWVMWFFNGISEELRLKINDSVRALFTKEQDVTLRWNRLCCHSR